MLRIFALFLLSVAGASAAPTYQAFLDTTPLGPGTFYLDFQFLSGDDVSPNGNNIFSLTDIDLGTGSLTGVAPNPELTGDVTGTFPAGYQFTDTQFFNSVLIRFTPGDFVRFAFTFTGNYTGGTPDTFSFAVLDSDFIPIVSEGLGASLLLEITGDNSQAQVFAASSDFGSIVPVVSEIPEPTSFLLVVPALALLIRRRKTASPSHTTH